MSSDSTSSWRTWGRSVWWCRGSPAVIPAAARLTDSTTAWVSASSTLELSTASAPTWSHSTGFLSAISSTVWASRSGRRSWRRSSTMNMWGVEGTDPSWPSEVGGSAVSHRFLSSSGRRGSAPSNYRIMFNWQSQISFHFYLFDNNNYLKFEINVF